MKKAKNLVKYKNCHGITGCYEIKWKPIDTVNNKYSLLWKAIQNNPLFW